MGDDGYRLEDQVGHLMRRAQQRHLAVFAGVIPELTTMQFAALAKLAEQGALSQNQLGRATAMDAATIKGVVGRLVARRLVTTPAARAKLRRFFAEWLALSQLSRPHTAYFVRVLDLGFEHLMDGAYRDGIPQVTWVYAVAWAAVIGIGGFVYFWKAEEQYGRG